MAQGFQGLKVLGFLVPLQEKDRDEEVEEGQAECNLTVRSTKSVLGLGP